ncbi:F-box/kelch-repeat protein-like protein [Tanacetum coccineum]
MSDYLCEEFIDEILERLPSKSLLRFRSVSKSWDCRISSPNFIRKHAIRSVTTTTCKKIRIRVITCFNQELAYVDWSVLTDEYTRRELAKFTESDYRITGSCFGIICMGTRKYYNPSVILWNPSVRRKLTVPDYPSRHFDGALHWVVQCETSNVSHYYILTFNLSTHVFGMISLPKPNGWNNQLTIIKDSLALVSSYHHETRVWIRREGNDNVASWSNASKLKSIELEDSKCYNPFTGVHYALEVDSYYRYMINMDICWETLELLGKETC